MTKIKRPQFTRWERERVKKLYDAWTQIYIINEQTGVPVHIINYMIDNISTFRIKEINWITHKRCLNCKVWKPKTTEYNKCWTTKSWTTMYRSDCKVCCWVKYKNDRILWKIDKEKSRKRNKEWWARQEKWVYYRKIVDKLKEEGGYWLFLARHRKNQMKLRRKKAAEKLQALIDNKRANEQSTINSI